MAALLLRLPSCGDWEWRAAAAAAVASASAWDWASWRRLLSCWTCRRGEGGGVRDVGVQDIDAAMMVQRRVSVESPFSAKLGVGCRVVVGAQVWRGACSWCHGDQGFPDIVLGWPVRRSGHMTLPHSGDPKPAVGGHPNLMPSAGSDMLLSGRRAEIGLAELCRRRSDDAASLTRLDPPEHLPAPSFRHVEAVGCFRTGSTDLRTKLELPLNVLRLLVT